MPILPVLTYPNQALKTICSAITDLNAELVELAGSLEETLEASPGCVGIAAPQVGATQRLIVVDASRCRKPVHNHGRLVLFNPVIEFQEGEALGREGCLSLPDLTANVRRAQRIVLRALGYRNGELEELTLDAEGFEARIISHEADHLDGLLFLDRVTSLKTDVFRRKNYHSASDNQKPATAEATK